MSLLSSVTSMDFSSKMFLNDLYSTDLYKELSVSALLSQHWWSRCSCCWQPLLVFSETGGGLKCWEHQLSSMCAAVTLLLSSEITRYEIRVLIFPPHSLPWAQKACWETEDTPTDVEMSCMLWVWVLTGDKLAAETQARCLNTDTWTLPIQREDLVALYNNYTIVSISM